MAEIRFDAARMQELSNRLDDIAEQLKSSNSLNSEYFAGIESNIKGSNVTNTLSKYRQAFENVSSDAYGLLLDVNGTLRQKISKYTETEQAAADVLTDVQSILAG